MKKSLLKVTLTVIEATVIIYVICQAFHSISNNDFAHMTPNQLTSEGLIVMGEIVFAILVILALCFVYCAKALRSIHTIKHNANELQKEREAFRAAMRKVS